MSPDAQRADHEHLVAIDTRWDVWRVGALRSAGLPFGMLARFAATEQIALTPGAERDDAIRQNDAAAVDAMVADDAFATALTWQSPAMVRQWVAAHRAALRAGGARVRATRRSTRFGAIARYAQRYCAKNESIGFFGPVAWARFHDGPTAVVGDGTLTGRGISYEVWAVRAVAGAWNNDPSLVPHLPVRLDPACVVVDGTIRRPRRRPETLSALAAQLVAGLAHATTVRELAARTGVRLADAAHELAVLHGRHIVQLGFLVPLHEEPERLLRAQVDDVDDADAATRLLARLDLLDHAKTALAAASGPEELLDAFADVDGALTAATGDEDTVRAGRTGLGTRTPVYHDCRRALDARIGPTQLAQLATPLGVLLDAARWLVCQAGDVVADGLRERVAHLRAVRGDVLLSDLQFAAADLLSTGGPGLAEVVADFHLRWAEIIATATLDSTGLTVDPARARTLADALFPAGTPRWSNGRIHSPDLMLADTARGRRWVVGELHLAVNTLESRLFATQSDDRAELVAAVGGDWSAGRVVPVYPTAGTLVSSRTYPPPALDPPGLFRYWSFGSDDGHPSGAPSVPATGLVVSDRDGELVAEAPGCRWAAPVMECFGEFLSALVFDLFQLRPPAPQVARLAIGDVVISRARWRVPVADVPVDVPRSRDLAHDRLRTWAAERGMPRHVFARTPQGRKPWYVDWHAPLLVENVARLLRRLREESPDDGWLEVVEMLPAPDELWLSDPDGHRYTSELRLVAVDRTPQTPVFRPASGASAPHRTPPAARPTVATGA